MRHVNLPALGKCEHCGDGHRVAAFQ